MTRRHALSVSLRVDLKPHAVHEGDALVVSRDGHRLGWVVGPLEDHAGVWLALVPGRDPTEHASAEMAIRTVTRRALADALANRPKGTP